MNVTKATLLADKQQLQQLVGYQNTTIAQQQQTIADLQRTIQELLQEQDRLKQRVEDLEAEQQLAEDEQEEQEEELRQQQQQEEEQQQASATTTTTRTSDYPAFDFSFHISPTTTTTRTVVNVINLEEEREEEPATRRRRVEEPLSPISPPISPASPPTPVAITPIFGPKVRTTRRGVTRCTGYRPINIVAGDTPCCVCYEIKDSILGCDRCRALWCFDCGVNWSHNLEENRNNNCAFCRGSLN